MEYFLYYIGGSSILIGAIAWLMKSLISGLISKDIETYKAQLKYDSDLQLEKLRNELKIQAQTQDIMFAKLHSKRIEIVDELYSQVQQVNRLAIGFGGSFIFGVPRQQKRNADSLYDACVELSSYYNENRLYLSENLVSHLGSLIDIITSVISEYDGNSLMSDSDSEFAKEFQQKILSHENEFVDITKNIESEFRSLVGSNI